MPLRACLFALLACPLSLAAQSAGSFSYSSVPHSNLPYSATFESKTVQTLADGTTISNSSKIKEARDSQGRTFHQVTSALQDGSERVMTFVNDPVSRTVTNWSSASNEAFVNHLPDPAEIRERAKSAPVKQQPPPQNGPRPSEQSENLGSKTIMGVVAEGIRETRTIPAGSQGNDRPLIIVTERWRSPDLGINLSTIRDDPRTGRSTQEVTEFDRGEPDPSLFQVPAGYTTKERNQQ
jgi:hypothetical protein